MRSLILILGLSFFAAFISSCSTISKEECEVGDWAGIGQRDASKGQKEDRYYTYVKECGEHGYKPDLNAYKTGYAEGLKTFCTAENGWRLGKNGTHYAGICPKASARAFENAYAKGKKVFDINQNINKITTEISDLDTKITEHQNLMVSGGKTGPEVAMLAIQMDKMRQQQRDLEKKRGQLQAELSLLDTAGVASE